MNIKFYNKDKLLAISNALSNGSGERDRQIVAMVECVDDTWDHYNMDNGRILCNKIDEFKRMFYIRNNDLTRKFNFSPEFYTGRFINLMEVEKKEKYKPLLGIKITCPICGKELTVRWFGIFHACYDSEKDQQYSINYDLHELFTLGRANEQFWKEINEINV